MSLKQLKRKAGYYTRREQGGRVYDVDLSVMAGLADAHKRKLRGELPNLERPDELSVYNPRGRSCLPANRDRMSDRVFYRLQQYEQDAARRATENHEQPKGPCRSDPAQAG